MSPVVSHGAREVAHGLLTDSAAHPGMRREPVGRGAGVYEDLRDNMAAEGRGGKGGASPTRSRQRFTRVTASRMP